MTDYTRGYTSTWRVRTLDPSTWLPGEAVDGIDSVSVSRSTGSSTPLLESGSMGYTGELAEGWYRIEALATQDGSGEGVPIATLLFAPEDTTWAHGTWGGEMSGRSVLAYAADKKMGRGTYAPKGADGALWCADMLRSCIPAPVSAVGSFTLSNHVVFDIGASVLEAVWAVLDAAGWCMQVDGYGDVTIMAVPTEPALEITEQTKKMLMPEIGRSLPIEDVPNVFMAYDGELFAEAVNDDPTSPTSTVARGRRIEEVEDTPTRVDGETLAQYALRRLSELSEIYETLDVEREYAEGVHPYSSVLVRLPEEGLDGTYTVMSQTVTCDHGVHVGETLGRRQAWS